MTAQNGHNVSVHYKGTLTDGTLFDSSEGREPLEFQLGSGVVIPGFNDGIVGMAIGDKKQVIIPSEQAYGPSIAEHILDVNRLDIPEDIPLELGATLNMHQGEEVFQVVIVELTATNVKLDGNHPLAGKDLIFDLELVGIN
jgi:peptidylprolyl isomerase